MPRDHRHPFDFEANEAADVTHEFWGATRGWTGGPDDHVAGPDWSDRTPRSIRAITTSLSAIRPRRPQQSARRTDATGRVDRTRSHGIPRPSQREASELERREPTLGELAAGWDEEDWSALDTVAAMAEPATRRTPAVARSAEPARQRGDDRANRPAPLDEHGEFDDRAMVPLTPTQALSSKLGLGAVDPLLARIGAIIAIGIMLVPIALATRGGGAQPALATGSIAAASAGAATLAAGVGEPAVTVVAPVADPTPQANPTSAVQAAPTSPAASDAEVPAATAAAPQSEAAAASTEAAAGDVPESAPVASAVVEAATVTEPAERMEPDCSLSYVAAPGDSWYRIADAAGVTPRALLDQNLAGLDTPIFPGDEICLPAGATVPERPTTTTAAPSTTAAPTTTAAPSTTAAPATTKPPPPPVVSTGAVQDLIREIWPDELEQRALEIAWRESNYKANAYNGSCCYGVFQIHWGAHKGWLDDYGITSTNDLLDARKNITAAYAIYQRAGGWGPWGG